MGSLAKQLSGQSDQVKMYAKGGKVRANPFEKSKKDGEVKGRGKGKEGSKKEEAFDKKQFKKGGCCK